MPWDANGMSWNVEIKFRVTGGDYSKQLKLGLPRGCHWPSFDVVIWMKVEKTFFNQIFRGLNLEFGKL